MDTLLAIIAGALAALAIGVKLLGGGRKKKIRELEDKLAELDKRAADLDEDTDAIFAERREVLRAQIDATARADSLDQAIDRVNDWLRSRSDSSSR